MAFRTYTDLEGNPIAINSSSVLACNETLLADGVTYGTAVYVAGLINPFTITATLAAFTANLLTDGRYTTTFNDPNGFSLVLMQDTPVSCACVIPVVDPAGGNLSAIYMDDLAPFIVQGTVAATVAALGIGAYPLPPIAPFANVPGKVFAGARVNGNGTIISQFGGIVPAGPYVPGSGIYAFNVTPCLTQYTVTATLAAAGQNVIAGIYGAAGSFSVVANSIPGGAWGDLPFDVLLTATA